MGYASLILCVFVAFASQILRAEGLSPKAQKILEEIPGKKITLDFVVASAIRNSDSYRALGAQLLAGEAQQKKAMAPVDTKFTASWAQLNDQREGRPMPFSTESTIGDEWSLGVSKYFSTGTALSLEAKQEYAEIEIPTLPEITFYESSAEIQLSQNLVKDFFGRSVRKALRAGETLKKSDESFYAENFEGLTAEVMGLFYGAWLAQESVRAARESVDRRQRLVKITKIRTERGTSELPDLLQTRSALLISQNQLDEAKQALWDQWRSLVVNLKLDQELLKEDPEWIPIEISDVSEGSLGLCGGRAVSASLETARLKRQVLAAEAANLNYEAARDGLLPEVQLFGSYGVNGVDADTRQASLDGADNPYWTLGLRFSMSLDRSAEKAALAGALAEKTKADAELSSGRDQLETDWISACADLRRLKAARERARETNDNQKKRVKLDENRFRIGRSTIFSVVQAGDDATAATIGEAQSMVSLQKAAWRVERLQNGLKNYFGKLGVQKK